MEKITQGAFKCEVNFSGDGQRLVSASSDKTARVWSAGSFGAAWRPGELMFCKGMMHAKHMSYAHVMYSILYNIV